MLATGQLLQELIVLPLHIDDMQRSVHMKCEKACVFMCASIQFTAYQRRTWSWFMGETSVVYKATLMPMAPRKIIAGPLLGTYSWLTAAPFPGLRRSRSS